MEPIKGRVVAVAIVREGDAERERTETREYLEELLSWHVWSDTERGEVVDSIMETIDGMFWGTPSQPGYYMMAQMPDDTRMGAWNFTLTPEEQ